MSHVDGEVLQNHAQCWNKGDISYLATSLANRFLKNEILCAFMAYGTTAIRHKPKVWDGGCSEHFMRYPEVACTVEHR